MPAAPSPVTFTLDLEDHRASVSDPIRYPDLVARILDFLDERQVRGTFFVVGAVAEATPGVVAEVARRGHEIGLHGWQHVRLTQLDAAVLGADLARGKALLEDIAGRAVSGFRAPTFSIVPQSLWALEVIARAGFAYSSSVLPAPNPLMGFPGAPVQPFRWPNGLVELPCPVLRAGRVGLPYLGGTYLRVLPGAVTRFARRRDAANPIPWLYCHPYDFDPDAPRWKVEPHWYQNRLLWTNRRAMFAKVERALAAGWGAPLGERVMQHRFETWLAPHAAKGTAA